MHSGERVSAEKLLKAIESLNVGQVNLMEVCGTHTMAIAKSGIRSLLPPNIKLLSGPGCPVCVTPSSVIDSILSLAMNKNVIITTYGDMVRVPGSIPGNSLQRARALGACVEVVYSPVDAITVAENNPTKEVVFLGVGFETTAPGTAACVLSAKERGVNNFTVWSMLKTVEPALRALMKTEGFDVQGLLCPGHVATVIGEKGFEFLPEEYNMPAVISGFEAEDILLSIYLLLRQIENGESKVENAYRRAVSVSGNVLAQKMIDRCFEPRFDLWRGMGGIERSGLGFREELSQFDAQRKFGIGTAAEEPKTACQCGQVITGLQRPEECPLFGKICTPEDPVGPCMVSSEGACAAAYKYQVV